MYNPVDFSIFIETSVSISLHDNVEFYLTSQVMLGKQGTEYGTIGNLHTLLGRQCWSF